MIYSVEDYYRGLSYNPAIRIEPHRLSVDRITMTLMIASAAGRKPGVDAITFLDLVKTAEEAGCLSVYVDVYGRPVSFILWGYCGRTAASEEPSISFAVPSDRRHRYIIDFDMLAGSLDETVAHWTAAHPGTWLTFRRLDRPKTYRTYRLDRIGRFKWHTSYVHERFQPPRKHGFAEYERASLEALAHATEVRSVIGCISRSDPNRTIDIDCVPSLIEALLGVDQLLTSMDGGRCRAAVVIAFSDVGMWQDGDWLDTRRFRDFVIGPDLIIVDAYGDPADIHRLCQGLLATLRGQAEQELHIGASVHALLGGRDFEGWVAVPPAGTGPIRWVRKEG
jgi:hypothetical protein